MCHEKILKALEISSGSSVDGDSDEWMEDVRKDKKYEPLGLQFVEPLTGAR